MSKYVYERLYVHILSTLTHLSECIFHFVQLHCKLFVSNVQFFDQEQFFI